MSKIYCPECGHVLGDTTKSIDCNINCSRYCKKTVRVRLMVAESFDILERRKK